MEDQDRWLSVAEISAYLGVRGTTLYKWIARKPGIPAHKVGRHWKFKRAEIDDWVKSGGAALKGASVGLTVTPHVTGRSDAGK